MEHMKKDEFSKKIINRLTVLNLTIVIFTFLAVWHTCDVSPLSVLIPSAFGEFATATGFYYYKAKRENEIKLRKQLGSEIYNETKGE